MIYLNNAYLSDLISKLPEENTNYIKYPDGTLIQWGRAYSKPDGSGYARVNFPKEFADTTYTMLASPEYASSTYAAFDVSTQQADNASAIIYFRQGDNPTLITGVYANWVAFGRWK